MRRIFLVRAFAKWAKKNHVPEKDLCKAITECASGLIDAPFGDVIKKRIRLNNQGKRGSARALIGVKELLAARRGDLWFFLYGFRKNEADELTAEDIDSFQRLATTYLTRREPELDQMCRDGILEELTCEEA